MPVLPSRKRLSPAGTVAEAGSLMGPLGAPAAIGGVLGKMAKLTPDDMALLNDLLGKPIRVGKRLLRLSSGDPGKNTAILHTDAGERVASPLDEFIKLFKSAGEETAEQFPEGAVMSQPGTRAPGGTIGPKGGLEPAKRKIPKSATR